MQPNYLNLMAKKDHTHPEITTIIDNVVTNDIYKADQIIVHELIAQRITVEDFEAKNAYIENLVATKADITELTAQKAQIENLYATKADIGELDAVIGNIGTLTSDLAFIKNLLAGNLTAGNIQAGSITAKELATGTITAGSGIIAEGAIGNAHISDLDAGKISAGILDTAKVEVIGTNGHLRIKGNRLQVFEGLGQEAFERVSLGDVNGDGTKYGFRVRGKDGVTVLFDENGVYREGITDGSITNDKISDDADIDGAKLNINSVIHKINDDGSESIKGSKVLLDGKNQSLEVAFTNVETSIEEVSKNVTYDVEIISSNGNIFKNNNISTTLTAVVRRGKTDITDTIDDSRFRWTRVSDDKENDILWNEKYFGGTKQITITHEDVFSRATFNCEILDI